MLQNENADRSDQDLDDNDYISTKEAAELLGVSTPTVRRRVDTGDLSARADKGRMLLLRSEVVALKHAQSPTPVRRRVGAVEEVSLVGQLSQADLTRFPMLLSPEQAAEILGAPVSTVRRMLLGGQLPVRMIGRTKRIPLPALVRWLLDDEVA